jgi:hypothetical protein
MWGTTSFYPKPTMDLRIGPSGRCSGQIIEASAFARFSEMFDFGLLQQYRPTGDICEMKKAAN